MYTASVVMFHMIPVSAVPLRAKTCMGMSTSVSSDGSLFCTSMIFETAPSPSLNVYVDTLKSRKIAVTKYG